MPGASDFIHGRHHSTQSLQTDKQSLIIGSRRAAGEAARVGLQGRTITRPASNPQNAPAIAGNPPYHNLSHSRQGYSSGPSKNFHQPFAESEAGSDFDQTIAGLDFEQDDARQSKHNAEEYQRHGQPQVAQQTDGNQQDIAFRIVPPNISISHGSNSPYTQANGMHIPSKLAQDVNGMMQNRQIQDMLLNSNPMQFGSQTKSQIRLPNTDRFGSSQSIHKQEPNDKNRRVGQGNIGQDAPSDYGQHRDDNRQISFPEIETHKIHKKQYKDLAGNNVLVKQSQAQEPLSNESDYSDSDDELSNVRDGDNGLITGMLEDDHSSPSGRRRHGGEAVSNIFQNTNEASPEQITPRANRKRNRAEKFGPDYPGVTLDAENLDYSEAILHRMKYSELREQPFDTNPRTPASILPEILAKPGISVEERLKHFAEANPTVQQQFFAQMPMEQWEHAGDWFLERFGEILSKVKEARRKKREVCKTFEHEIASREEAVQSKIEGINYTMEQMRQNGMGVLQVRSR